MDENSHEKRINYKGLDHQKLKCITKLKAIMRAMWH